MTTSTTSSDGARSAATQRVQPVRLLAVLPSPAGGGAEQQMLLLLSKLPANLWEPWLCLFDAAGELQEQVPDGTRTVVLGKRSRWDVFRLVLRLAQLIDRTRPDIIYSKLAYANVVTSAAAMLSHWRCPIICSEDSLQSRELPRYRLPRLRSRMIRWAYQRAAAVVVPSEGVARDLRERLRISDLEGHVIPNGVQIPEGTAGGSPIPRKWHRDEAFLITAAGRLDEAKGQADLIRAIGILNAARPVHAVIMGVGDDRARLEQLARDLSLADRVTFAGFVKDPSIMVAQSHVFVSPSHWETFGNAIVEAMSVGTPVVATRVPVGPLEIIHDRANGIFANPHDPEDLAAKIEMVLDDPQLAAQLAVGGAASARLFDIDRVVDDFVSLIDELLCRRGTVSRSTTGSVSR